MKKYLKLIFTLFLLLLLPVLLFQGEAVGDGVRQGLELAYRSVLPALFPAMILCGMVGELAELIPLPPAVTLWATSHLCGFPLGIRMTVRAYQREIITREQAIRLSCCTANASPAFLILYIGKTVLGDGRQGLLLFLAQLTVSFLIAHASGLFMSGERPLAEERPLSVIIAGSFGSAATGAVMLTGYITAFSGAAGLLRGLPGFSYWYAFLELTGGISALPKQLPLIAAAVGFSGLSVFLQNAGYLLEENLPLWPMAVGKMIYTIVLPLMAVIAEHAGLWSLPVMAIFGIILISFDKRRKKRYNKIHHSPAGRTERNYDLFQRG